MTSIKPNARFVFRVGTVAAVCLSLVACKKKEFNPADGAPPASQPVETGDMSFVQVDKPDLFPVVAS